MKRRITLEQLMKEWSPLNRINRTADTATAQVNQVGNAATTQINQVGNAATTQINRLGNDVSQTAQAATTQINRVGNDVSQTAQAATQAANSANSTFNIIGRQVDQVAPTVQQAAGQIATTGATVDKSLKILTPVVAVAGATFGAVQLSKLVKSIKGNKATSDVELEFDNRAMADQFAGKILAHKDLKPYCKVKSIQSQKVVLSVDTKYLTKNYNQFNKTVQGLMTTKKKRMVSESLWMALGMGVLGTLGSMMVAPIVNKVQGKSGVNTIVTYQFKDAKAMNQFVKMMKTPEMQKASVKVVGEDNANKTVTIQADEKKVQKVFPQIEQQANANGAVGGEQDGEQMAAEALNENTKITLTVGQIRRLVRECREHLDS